MDVLKNNWKKILSICIVVFLFLFILGFGLVRTDTADLLASESNNHVTSIKAHVVEKISIEDKISFMGDLEASEIEIVK